MSDVFPGDVLRKEREKAGLSPEQVAGKVNISAVYITALEADDLAAFPSLTYYKGFLRIYSDFFGLDFDSMLNRLEALCLQRAPLPPDLLKRHSGWRRWGWLVLVAALGLAGGAYWWFF